MKTHRKSITLLLTLALLFNAMSPLLFAFNVSPASTDSAAESMFGDKILICTSTGFKYVSIEDFRNGSLPDQKNALPHCSLCIINSLLAHNFIPAVITSDLPQLGVVLTLRYRDVTQNISRHYAANNSYSRAPPYFL